jgi:NMD protein affecting ribosome stability and mRNA decay
MGINHKLSALTAAALLAAPLAAHAQPKEQYTYRCVGNDGKKYYGQTLPQQCLGRPVELINKQGLVVKRIDHEGEEKARLAKEAEAEKQRELELAAKDAQRRHRALLATYSSEKEIEDARTRDLREHQKQLREVEDKIDAIKKRQQQFQKELALFKGADGDGPTRLKQEIVNANIDLRAQQTLLDAKKKDALGINARYDEDRKRYAEAIGATSKR